MAHRSSASSGSPPATVTGAWRPATSCCRLDSSSDDKEKGRSICRAALFIVTIRRLRDVTFLPRRYAVATCFFDLGPIRRARARRVLFIGYRVLVNHVAAHVIAAVFDVTLV